MNIDLQSLIQFLMLGGTIVGGYVKLTERVTRLETKVEDSKNGKQN